MRRAAKVDANQGDIVSALRSVGASVQPLHAVGDGVPDLLVGYRGQNYLVEVKNPAGSPSQKTLTPAQAKWHEQWRGQVAIAEIADDAFEIIGVVCL